MLSEGNSVSKKAVFGNDIEKSRPTIPISIISSSTATWRLGVIAEISSSTATWRLGVIAEDSSSPISVESRTHKAFLRCSTRDLMVSCIEELFKVEDESANP